MTASVTLMLLNHSKHYSYYSSRVSTAAKSAWCDPTVVIRRDVVVPGNSVAVLCAFLCQRGD